MLYARNGSLLVPSHLLADASVYRWHLAVSAVEEVLLSTLAWAERFLHWSYCSGRLVRWSLSESVTGDVFPCHVVVDKCFVNCWTASPLDGSCIHEFSFEIYLNILDTFIMLLGDSQVEDFLFGYKGWDLTAGLRCCSSMRRIIWYIFITWCHWMGCLLFAHNTLIMMYCLTFERLVHTRLRWSHQSFQLLSQIILIITVENFLLLWVINPFIPS